MAKNEEVLNDYRAERKERIAKAAKKKNKAHRDSTSIIAGVIYAIAGIVVVGLIVAALNYFGVFSSMTTAVKVGDRSYSKAEYSYYYSTIYQSLSSQASEQKETYGFSLFDTTKDPAAQIYQAASTTAEGDTEGEEKEEMTYADYIHQQVLSTLEQTNYYLAKAQAANMTLNGEHQASVDQTIDQISTYADNNGYSASRYVSLLYGSGMNIKVFRQLLEEQYLVSQYLEDVEDTLAADIPDADIEAKYEEAPADYKVVDIRLFGLEIPEAEESDDTTETTEETTETTDSERLVKEFEGRITDEASFITLAKEYCEEEDKATFENDSATIVKNLKKSVISSNISADLAEWLFSADRKAGDTTTTTTDSYAYVLYVINPAYRNEDCLVDARHILVSFENIKSELDAAKTSSTDAETTETTEATEVTVETATAADGTEISNEGTGYSIDVVVAAYNKAQELMAEYGKNETEDNFAQLAEDNSADSGSIGDNGSGGLYESIEKGKMVAEFENWCYDETRQPGDTGIIRTQYGYHIMYFVKQHAEPTWKETVRNSIASTLAEEAEETAKAEYEGTAVPTAKIEKCKKEALELVNKIYVSQNS